MEKLKNKKTIALIVVLIILFTVSVMMYGRNKEKVFQDEYMDNIFVEEEEKEILVEVGDTEANKSYIVVEVKGEVTRPDVYELEEGSIVKELIDMAGGLTKEADISRINRAKKLQNHELVVIGNINDKENTNMIEESSEAEYNGLININSANLEELKKISGVGDVKAQSIIEYREKNGGFKSIDEIKNIDGIGEKTFEKIKDKITL